MSKPIGEPFGHGLSQSDIIAQHQAATEEILGRQIMEAEEWLANYWGVDAALFRKETEELVESGWPLLLASSAAFLRVRERAERLIDKGEGDIDLLQQAAQILDGEIPF
jgi:hypothetical protein